MKRPRSVQPGATGPTIKAHVAHRFSTFETATYGGGDHILLDEPLRTGRLRREVGDPLCKPARSWPWRGAWTSGEENRGPNCKRCQQIAARLGITELVGNQHVYFRRDGEWAIEDVNGGRG